MYTFVCHIGGILSRPYAFHVTIICLFLYFLLDIKSARYEYSSLLMSWPQQTPENPIVSIRLLQGAPVRTHQTIRVAMPHTVGSTV